MGRDFYHLPEEISLPRMCHGLACFVAGGPQPSNSDPTPRLYCLGKCYNAPASIDENREPVTSVAAHCAIVLERIIKGVPPTLQDYYAADGYQALAKVRQLSTQSIIGQLERAQLRGRGGAGYPTGKKWRAVYNARSETKFIVANADEGDPGAYIDRIILERDPHVVFEAMAIAGHVLGAKRGFIYLRREYPAACRRLREALAEINSSGIIAPFEIELRLGEGSYVCGEETALLNAIEGKRPEVRTRPPFPADQGLFGAPTLINNIETLANIPWIIRHGAEAYSRLGFSRSRGTKVVSLNSLFRHPGLYEVEFGMPLRQIVEQLGGGLRHDHSADGQLYGVIIGGPLAGVVPANLLDVRLGFEELQQIGAAVGHGGIVAFGRRTTMAELIQHVFSFGAYESCGKCTPCRVGSARLSEMNWTIGEWNQIVEALQYTSLCGLGTGLAEFANSLTRHFSEDVANLCQR